MLLTPLAENRRTVRVRNATRATQARFLTDNRWEVLSGEIDEDTNPAEAVERVIDTFNEVGTDVGPVRDSVEGPRARRRMTNAYKNASAGQIEADECVPVIRVEKTIVGHLKMPGSTHDTQARENSRVSWRRQLEELRHHCGRGDTKSTWSRVKRFTKPRSSCSTRLPAIRDSTEYSELTRMVAAAWVEYYRKLFADPTGHSRDVQWWKQFAPRDIECPDSVDILD